MIAADIPRADLIVPETVWLKLCSHSIPIEEKINLVEGVLLESETSEEEE